RGVDLHGLADRPERHVDRSGRRRVPTWRHQDRSDIRRPALLPGDHLRRLPAAARLRHGAHRSTSLSRQQPSGTDGATRSKLHRQARREHHNDRALTTTLTAVNMPPPPPPPPGGPPKIY